MSDKAVVSTNPGLSDGDALTGPTHFIKQQIQKDLASGKVTQIVTRFPPEPNGYLHIGHAKSIWINFGLAQQFQGVCHLRMDDTNPEKEDLEYVDAIKRDIAWLGYEWFGPLRFASDYFEDYYNFALELIQAGKAYVCELSPDEAREYRGTLTSPGRNSPFRDRPIQESLDMFAKMRAGKLAEGTASLRAKIDMASPNINMRDPILYRIRFAEHHQTGKAWCIYPMYDYAHCISDAIEGITHSLCSLEFEDHRPLYNWILENISIDCHPQQIEFARLNPNYTITSKRKLRKLVDGGFVDGWDDPRLPTLAGLRRRGFTAASLRKFCEATGVSKANSVVDVSLLEWAIRDELDSQAPRAMCVLQPLKVTLTNYPADQTETLTLANHPKDESFGQREIPFSRELWIDHNDFLEDAPKKFFRLAPGKEVRLRGAYIIKCEQVIKNEQGEIVELLCTFDKETLGKMPTDRKVKGVIHWVAAQTAVPVKVCLYDRLFSVPLPEAADENGEAVEFTERLNPESLIVTEGVVEPAVAKLLQENPALGAVQFEREGYFVMDAKTSTPEQLVFNRIVSLKDSWEKMK